jgi:hypothetical protein
METLPRDVSAEASSGGVSPAVEECALRAGHADLAPSDTFPVVPCVASLAMVASTRLSRPRDCVGTALGAYGNVTA